MTAVEAGLVSQLVLAALAVAVALTALEPLRSLLAGLGGAVVGVAGAVTGALAMAGHTGRLVLPVLLPVHPMTLDPDRLGGLFMLLTSLVGVLVSVFGIRYASGPSAGRAAWSALAVFLLGMQLVPAAADVVSFLLAWELMAVGSTVLLLADHGRRTQVTRAALWYATLTQLSFLLLLAGFAVLAAASGSSAFAAIAAHPVGTATADVAFVLLLLGFGTKAGLVPLHVWLPRAHPEAPSHASAAMSAAMVSVALYGLLLVCVRLFATKPAWWGVLLVGLGALSALYGILQASVASDLKRLLAYSTTENVGLVVLALGSSVLLRSAGAPLVADAALTASLMLVVSHALFKASLFLGAGAVLHATGERDLDRLGGLGARMPRTAAAFGLAGLGAVALPGTVGFVAEWTLLQSLIHGGRSDSPLVHVVMPLAVGVVALTTGLALLTFVKAYGIAFLAMPRSEDADTAHEVPRGMTWPMLAGSLALFGLGLLPGPLAVALARTVGAGGVDAVGLGGLRLSALPALLDPAALALLSLAVVVLVLLAVQRAARRHPVRATELAWGCGGARTSPRMQYTATSYAEPLLRVFDDALRPSRDLEVTHVAESRYLVQRVEYRQRVADVVETRLYVPVIGWAGRLGVRARGLQSGSIHRYLGYSFAALLAVLVVVSL